MRKPIWFIALLTCGCSATTIQSSWTDPTFSGARFDRVAVVALFDTAAESRTFEQTAARALGRIVDAVPAYTILGGDQMREQDELRAELAAAGIDGILIYRLIAVDERNVYRNPTPYLNVPPSVLWGDPYYWYYYPRWDYYWHWRSTWDVTHAPGYWESLRFVVVESSFYDARSDRLLWTAKSETIEGAQFDRVAESIAAKVTDEISDLIEPSAAPAERSARLQAPGA